MSRREKERPKRAEITTYSSLEFTLFPSHHNDLSSILPCQLSLLEGGSGSDNVSSEVRGDLRKNNRQRLKRLSSRDLCRLPFLSQGLARLRGKDTDLTKVEANSSSSSMDDDPVSLLDGVRFSKHGQGCREAPV